MCSAWCAYMLVISLCNHYTSPFCVRTPTRTGAVLSKVRTTTGSWVLRAIHPVSIPTAVVLSSLAGERYVVDAFGSPSVCVLVLVRVPVTAPIRLIIARHLANAATTAYSMPPFCTRPNVRRTDACRTGATTGSGFLQALHPFPSYL